MYPELPALEEGGYVVSVDEPHGARPRKAYRLTDQGRAALDEWLRGLEAELKDQLEALGR